MNTTASEIVLKKLSNHPMEIQEIVEVLKNEGVISSERTAKETVWKLVEEGKARINDEWRLEEIPNS